MNVTNMREFMVIGGTREGLVYSHIASVHDVRSHTVLDNHALSISAQWGVTCIL